ncbi:MAG: twin-arginine translocase TatA/TatE family subunit [Myxococcales bacterium]|nr:twin-arginine translocase TatA/TatE family subunit [Myxococcales bacterium]
MMGGWEWGVILLLVLIVFGAGKLPDIFRQAGKGIRAFKDASEGKGDVDDAGESEEEKAARLQKREEKKKRLAASDDLDGDPDEAKAHSSDKEVR